MTSQIKISLKNVFMALCLLVIVSTATVAQNRYFTVDATLADSGKGAINGSREVLFQIYKNVDLSTGSPVGEKKWEELRNPIQFSNGTMSVDLGTTTVINPEIFKETGLSIVIKVTGVEGYVSLPLRHVPYSFFATISSQSLSVSGNNIVGSINNNALSGAYKGITGLGLLTSLNVQSDVVVDTTTFKVDSILNRVGIGTASPAYTLDVNGSVRIQSGQLIFPDGTTMSTGAAGTGLVATGSVVMVADSDKNGSGQVRMNIGDTTWMTLTNTGLMGIGVTAPIARLDVNGRIRIGTSATTNVQPGLIEFDGSNFRGYKNGGWVPLDIQSASGGGWNSNAQTQIISLTTASDKVGIGTTQPSTKLQVIGTVNATAFSGSGSGLTQLNPSALSAPVPISKGGTGVSTFNASSLVYVDTLTNTLKSMPVMGAGELLIGDGTGTPNIALLTFNEGISIQTGQGTIQINHFDTSTADSVINTPGIGISGISVDTFGHVTEISTSNLDDRYMVKQNPDSQFLETSGGEMTGTLFFRGVTQDPTITTVSDNERILIQTKGVGRVGINVSSPQQLLDVNGGIRLGNTTLDVAGSLRFTGSTFEGFTGSQWVDLQGGGGGGSGETVWQRASGLATLQNPTDKVGIGLASPEEPLHVSGNAWMTGTIRTSQNVSVSGEVRWPNGTKISNGQFTGNWQMNNGTLGNIQLITANRITIQKQLNFGSGTGAYLNLPASTTVTASMILASGSLLTTPVAGAIEFNGTQLYYTDNSARREIINANTIQSLINKTLSNSTLQSNSIEGTWAISNALSIQGIQNMAISSNAWAISSLGVANFATVNARFSGDGSALTNVKQYWAKVNNKLNVTENVGIGITDPTAALHVISDAGVMFAGTLNSGSIPVEANTAADRPRFMWVSKKAALRAGYLDASPLATKQNWDDANVGLYSVAFGHNSKASGIGSSVLGGDANSATGNYTVVAAGRSNRADGLESAVVGGVSNISSGSKSFVGGGNSNKATNSETVVAGGDRNTASALQSSVLGGSQNTASGQYAVVGGGTLNQASGYASAIVGGASNQASNIAAYVGGGELNNVSDRYAAISGGYSNTIGVGGRYSVISGGRSNQVTGRYSTIAGGVSSNITVDNAFAGGTRAKVAHKGSFLWADSTDADLNSDAADQFLARASGGVKFYTNSAMTSGVSVDAGGGSWNTLSDKNLKTNNQNVNTQDVLDKLAAIPIQTWNYKTQDPSIKHMGPMAQDFYAGFKLGSDDRHINTVDADGVMMAAIQALYKQLQDKEKRIQALEAKVDALSKK